MEQSTTEALSLHEVADLLGVHYMTAYKYVKTGDLPAHQVGRRWMVDPSDVDTFVEQSRTGDARRQPAEPPTVSALRERMECGDEDGAWELLHTADLHLDPLRAQQSLIVPALRETGERWSNGIATIAEEHMATVVARRLIYQLGTPQRRGRRSGRVIVLCPASDPHTLATALFSNLVRNEGADVVDLGRVGSADVVLSAIDAGDANVSVAIAVTVPEAVEDAAELAEAVRTDERVRAVLIGGLAIPDEEAAEAVGSDLYFGSSEMAAAGAAAASRI